MDRFLLVRSGAEFSHAGAMNRRDFLITSSGLTAAGLLLRSPAIAQTPASSLAARPATATPAPAVPEFLPLRRDVGVFTARGGSIAWLASAAGLAAVDTQFPDTAAQFLAGLPGRGGRPLDVVINSHHHGDHTGGNGIFRPAAKSIVAHVNAPRLQRERAERDGTLARQTYADTTFSSTWRQEIGSEVIRARYHGRGHTSGDIVTYFEKANVIHLGDLMFNRVYPFIDLPGGASIRHWAVLLEEVARTYPTDAIYIFGHGNPAFGVTGRSTDLLVLRDYLSALLDHVRRRIAAGEPKEKIVALDNLPGFPDFHLPVGPANRLPGNLSAAYDELIGQTG